MRPRPLPTRDYLGTNLFVGAVISLVVQLLIAGLAISRAQDHRLTGWSVAIILIGGAVTTGVLNSLLAYVGGVFDSTEGRVLPDDRGEPAAARPLKDEPRDPLAPGTIWRRAFVWSAGAAVWGVAVAFLIVAALDGRSATYPIVLVGLLAVSSTIAIASNLLWRATGVGVARGGGAGTRTTLRRRAWTNTGLPIALVFAGATALFTWVLFHDYAVGDAFAKNALTEGEIFADLPVMLLIVGGLSAYAASQLARADVRLRYVRPDDPATQMHGPKVSFGPQALTYTVLATFVFAGVVRLAVPASPNLAEAMAVRSVIAGLIAWAFAGFAYVRAAGNEFSRS